MSKIKAYSYIRFSTPEQKQGSSYQRQIELSENYAKENNLELVETPFFDEGISAFKGKNLEGNLGKFITLVEDGKIDRSSYLLVESFDRLSRQDILTALETFTSILKTGITIVTLIDKEIYTYQKIQNNFSSLIVSLSIMARANEESSTKSKRLKVSWNKKRGNIASKVLSKRVPAWLKVNSDYTGFEVIQENAEIVNKIFEMVIEGYGGIAITKYLNKHYKAFGRTSIWHISYVRKILSNSSVIGHFQPHEIIEGKRVPQGDIIKDYYPVIVEPAIFYNVQQILKSRKNNSGIKGKKFSNLFQHLLKCNVCGSPLVYIQKGERSKPFLRCRGAHYGQNYCTATAWNYADFERLFLEMIQEINLEELLSSSNSSKDDLEKQRIVLEIELTDVQKKLNDIQSSIINSSTFEESFLMMLNESVKKLNEQRTSIENRLQDVNIKITDFENNSVKTLDEQLKFYYEAIEGKTDEEIFKVRSSINQHLKNIIKVVKVNTYAMSIIKNTEKKGRKAFRELLKLSNNFLVFFKGDKDTKMVIKRFGGGFEVVKIKDIEGFPEDGDYLKDVRKFLEK